MRPDDDYRQSIVRVIEGARRALLWSAPAAAALAFVGFIFSRRLIALLAGHVHVTLYYYTLSEVFFSSVEIALYTGIFFAVPVLIFTSWREARKGEKGVRLGGYLPAAFAVVLFYLGCAFCYLVVLPSGIGFLLGYEGHAVRAMISTEHFVHFCAAMVLAFGAAFELPVLLLILGRLGIVTYRALSRTRRYAVLAVVIAASVITPPPDVYNMSLLAVPLYALYELGILLLRMGERGLTVKGKSV